MESQELKELELNHVQECLNKYKKDFEYIYKQKLIDDHIDPGSKLIQTCNAEIQFNGLTMSVKLNLQDYWKFVENGRAPGGKFPPILKIEDWIKERNILPRPDKNGKLPSQKSLAYLIARKISEDGIEPGKQLEDSIQEMNNVYMDLFKEALQQDFNDYQLKILEKINKMFIK